jgi:cytoskeletal protein RodZ
MQTLGERLEEARKRKGISIREAAEATKIRGDYLQKFEANSFDLDLPPLYVRGFVRAYARYLEFDAQRILAEYDTLLASEGRAPRRESREVYGRVEFGEAGEAGGSTNAQKQAILLKYGLFAGGGVVLIIVIVLLVNVLFTRAPAKPAGTTAATPVTAPAQPAETAAESATQTLTFTASEATRLKIVQDSDKRVLFDGALARGETRSFRKTGKLLITVEKGSALRMEVNGRSYPVPLEGYGRFALD